MVAMRSLKPDLKMEMVVCENLRLDIMMKKMVEDSKAKGLYIVNVVKDIDHTENNKESKVQTIACSYHLNKLMSASSWSSLSCLITSVQ